MFISKNLLVFITTVQEGSLTNAAIKLFSTLPPMSRSIKILEDELGFKLFTRTTTRLTLTDRGAAFYKDIYSSATCLTNLSTVYKKNKSGVINIGTHQLKSEYAGFLCNYFLEADNYNIELKENTIDINQLDLLVSTKKIKDSTFDVELTANCRAILLYGSYINELPEKTEYIKNLPLLQSSIFSSSCCFKRFLNHMKQQGYRGDVLHIDDPKTRYNLIRKGGGISLTLERFSAKKGSHNTENISRDITVDFNTNYYIYFNSTVISKDSFIKYVQENSSLSWREVRTN